MSKDKMCPGGPCEDAEMTGPNGAYQHPKGTGGAGGSPCKFRKREGTLNDGRIVHGMNMKDCCETAPVHKGPQSNFD